MIARRWWLVIILLAFANPVQAQTATPPSTNLPADHIAYLEDNSPQHTLTIALPQAGTALYPTLLLLHGTGASSELLVPQQTHLLAQGYAVVSINFATETNVIESIFCALSWVHTHADTYRFDMSRIAAFGYSKAAWPAALLGTVENGNVFLDDRCPNSLPDDSRVQAVITYGGALVTPQTLLTASTTFSQEQIEYLEYLAQVPPSQWGEFLGEAWQKYLRPLPVYWLDSTDAPFLIIHSGDDSDTPVLTATSFTAAVQSVGGKATLVLLPEGNHQLLLFNGGQSPIADAATDAFLADRLPSRESAGLGATPTTTPIPS